MMPFPPYMKHWNSQARQCQQWADAGQWLESLTLTWELLQQYPATELLTLSVQALDQLGYPELAQRMHGYQELLYGTQPRQPPKFDIHPHRSGKVFQEIQTWLGASPASLSLCLMVRDEAAAIADFMTHTAESVNEWVIVDTGSVDSTREQIAAFAPKARLFEQPWSEDFAAARNAAVTQAQGDWILIMDPDERLTLAAVSWLQQLRQYRPLGLFVISGLVFNELAQGTQQGWIALLFPRHPALRYYGRIHHQLQCFQPPYYVQSVLNPTLQVRHWGYQPEVMLQKNKSQRWQLLATSLKDPAYDTPYLHYQYAYALLYLFQPADPERALRELKYSWTASLAGLTDGPPGPTWCAASLDMVALLLGRTLYALGHFKELMAHFREYLTCGNWTELAWLYAQSCWQQGAISEAKKWAWICFDRQLRHYQNPDPFDSWQPARLLLQIAQQEQDDWGCWAWCHQGLEQEPSELKAQLALRLGGTEAAILDNLEQHLLACLESHQWEQALLYGVYFLGYRTDALIGKYVLLSLRAVGLFHLARQVGAVLQFLYPQDSDWHDLIPQEQPDQAIMSKYPPAFWLESHYTFSPEPASLSACMIVKNEASLIVDCLKSLQTLVTEWVIVDTGSTDETMALIQQQMPTARVLKQPWADDFSQVRNWGVQQATGDWILSVDADEQLEPASIAILQQILRLRLPTRQALAPQFVSLYDNSAMSTVDMIPRLWRRSSQVVFYGRVHNRLGRSDQPTPLHVLTLPALRFKHLGFLSQYQRSQHKPNRYHILQKSRFDPGENCPYIQYHYGHYLAYHQQPPSLEAAIQEWQQALAKTLPVSDPLPRMGWLPAPLGLTCLAIFRAWWHLGNFGEMVAHAKAYQCWAAYDEFYFLYGCALVELHHYAQAITLFKSCGKPTWPALQPGAGFSTWQPLLMLVFCYVAQGNIQEAIASCYRILDVCPDGEVPGYGNIQTVLAQLCQQVLNR